MAWRFELAPLTEADSRRAVAAFPDSEPRIEPEGPTHWLVADLSGTEVGRASEQADALLGQMSGFLRLVHPAFQRMRIGTRFEAPDGRRGQQIFAPFLDGGEVFAPSIGPERPPPGPVLIHLAEVDRAAHDLLYLAAEHPLDWITLYKLYEIVRAAVGGARGIEQRGWATAGQINTFTASANRPELSGLDARHARMAGTPPNHSMPLEEARDMVSMLVRRYLFDRIEAEGLWP